MQDTNFFKHLRILIGQDELKTVFGLLFKLLEFSPKLDDAIMQSARFEQIRNQIKNGTIHYSHAEITQNQIRSSLLDLIREIEVQSDLPEHSYEIENAISSIWGKNIIVGSSITAGGNIQIGDNNVFHYEDLKNRYFKYIILFFILPGVFLYLLYFVLVLSKPFNLTVYVQEEHPIPGLTFKSGNVTLFYEDKVEVQPIISSAIFRQIPPNLKGQKAKVLFESPGFQTIDTSFLLSDNILLPIRRDSTLAHIFGTIKDENDKSIQGAEITILDISTFSDSLGRFSLRIPLEKQRKEQRIRIYKKNYGEEDRTYPINNKEEYKFILKLN